MPTRKQRRRREKDFRHDVRVFEVDEEGNEVALAELRTPEERGSKTKQQGKPVRNARGRAIRVPPEPSWHRALRRGGVMGAVMLFAFLFLFKSAPLGLRIAWGAFYAAAFIPLTYWIDRTAYRTYQRRVARQSDKKS
ncbi:MAG: hypothetical protein ACJ76I_12660 [Gaiellaceae bacterium]